MNSEMLASLSPLLILIVFMYFFFVRPQRKREKATELMRKNLQVGDEIITIGGICGKIVKTKDETIVIQVGAEKMKFEMMRWSVSSVVNRNVNEDAKKAAADKKDEAPAQKKSLPKRMKKAEAVSEESVESVATETTEA